MSMLLFLWACAVASPPPTPLAVGQEVPLYGSPDGRKLSETLDRLRGQLSKDFPGQTIKTTATQGPQDLVFLKAWVVDAYPGSGVFAAIAYQQQSYGIHGDLSLADLMRRRGWIDAPPPELAQIVDVGHFEGMGGLHDLSIRREDQSLILDFRVVSFPAADRSVTLRIGPSGPEREDHG